MPRIVKIPNKRGDEPMVRKRFSIKKFVKSLYSNLKNLPKHLTKFSKKTFTIPQIITLRALKEVTNKSYDSLVDFLEDFPSVGNLLELKRIPDPSTIRKYGQRIGIKVIENTLYKNPKRVAIDATGFENNHASKHYCRTINIKFSRRKYVKLSIAVDTDKQLICSHKSRVAPAHDTKDFIPLLKKIKTEGIKEVCADKGYDSKKNRYFVYYKIKAKPNIPKRKITGKTKLNKMFDDKTYHQRSKAETIFSVMKRLFGSYLRSKKIQTQKLELAYKCLAYNTRREVICSEMLINGGCP